MSQFVSAVNQKQYYAGLLLEKCLPDDDAHGHAAIALAESALYQLESAYRCHLRSVAEGYRCPDPAAVNTVEQLARALEAIDKHPAEAVEMFNLEQDEQSWLFQVLKAHEGMTSVVAASEGRASIEKSGISLREVSAEGEFGLSVDLLRQWLAAFAEIVDRHREMMIEC